MSEFGTIIEPYRGVPSQGNVVEDILKFAGMQQLVQDQRRKELERQASNYLINQNMGWSGVDPQQVQQFEQGNQNMAIAGANEARTQQQYDDNRNFAQQFVPRAVGRGGQDPFLSNFQGVSPTTAAAQAILGYIGQQGLSAQEQAAKQNMFKAQLENQKALEAMQTAGARDRAIAVVQEQNRGEIDRINRLNELQQDQYNKAMGYFPKLVSGEMRVGDLLASKQIDSQTALVLQNDVQSARAEQKAAADAAKAKAIRDAAVATATPITRSAFEATKAQEYNRQNNLWEFLPDKEKAIFDKEGKQLLDRIADAIRTSYVGPRYGGYNPTPKYSDNLTAEQYRALMPHIYRMTQEYKP